jgi:hypothetical protein
MTIDGEVAPQENIVVEEVAEVSPEIPAPKERSRGLLFSVMVGLFVVGILLGWGFSGPVENLASDNAVVLGTPTPVYPQNDVTLFSSSVTLVWTSIASAEDYLVYVFSSSDSSDPLYSVDVVLPTCMLTGLNDGSYSWSARALSGYSHGGWSSRSSFSILTSLGTPILVSPASSAVLTTSNILFQWTAPAGAEMYELQISASRYFGTVLLETIIEVSSYQCACQFETGTTYYWRVMSFGQGLSSNWSSIASFSEGQGGSSESGGLHSLTWTWTFPEDDSSWSFSFDVSSSEYSSDQQMTRNEASPSDYSKYVTASEATIVEIANYLVQQSGVRNYSGYQTIWLALSFVQATTYETDLASKGVEEYPRYPIETLVDGVGDCEDTAALFVSIARDMGYPSVQLYIYAIFGSSSNHMGTAVAGAAMPAGSSSITCNGIPYYYCETTSVGWEPGELPSALRGAQYEVVP